LIFSNKISNTKLFRPGIQGKYYIALSANVNPFVNLAQIITIKNTADGRATILL
jgi:hypothetical protein